MNYTKVLLALAAAVQIASGLFDGYRSAHGRLASGPIDIGIAFVWSAMTFAWYHFDSRKMNYRRSALMSMSVIVLWIAALPVYLAKSRAPGAKLGAVLRFFGVVLAMVLLAGATTLGVSTALAP